MKRLLNTLYVITKGARLSRENETVCVKVDREIRLRVPLHTLDGIVCIGYITCSVPLMHLCGERNVTLSFISEHGRFLARVQGPVSGNVLLRREQYRRADDENASSQIARAVVAGKLLNGRTALQRALRDHSDHANANDLKRAVAGIGHVVNKLGDAETLDVIRGCEGDASRIYFSVFDHLILVQKKEFYFHERSRRPPRDNMNALLSFLYTLLVHDVTSALEGVGLDPAVGYLHRDRPGRSSLALDMMEELRPMLADRLALSLVNRQQINGHGFRTSETGAVEMDDGTRKTLLVAYQERKSEKINHPFLDESIQVGLIPHVQAMLMARYLRGDLDGYPPFFWK